MKKLLFLLTIFISLSLLNSCKKPTGQFIIDNYIAASVEVSWGDYDLYCSSLGYTSTTVESGTHTATGYVYGYSLGSVSFNVPEDGSNTLYIYPKKSGNIKDGGNISITNMNLIKD